MDAGASASDPIDELIAELEDRFDVSIPLNDVPATRTVAQVVAQVTQLVAQQPQGAGEDLVVGRRLRGGDAVRGDGDVPGAPTGGAAEDPELLELPAHGLDGLPGAHPQTLGECHGGGVATVRARAQLEHVGP